MGRLLLLFKGSAQRIFNNQDLTDLVIWQCELPGDSVRIDLCRVSHSLANQTLGHVVGSSYGMGAAISLETSLGNLIPGQPQIKNDIAATAPSTCAPGHDILTIDATRMRRILKAPQYVGAVFHRIVSASRATLANLGYRHQAAHPRYLLRYFRDRKLDFFIGRKAANAKADRGLGKLIVPSQRTQYVRRFSRC